MNEEFLQNLNAYGHKRARAAQTLVPEINLCSGKHIPYLWYHNHGIYRRADSRQSNIRFSNNWIEIVTLNINKLALKTPRVRTTRKTLKKRSV